MRRRLQLFLTERIIEEVAAGAGAGALDPSEVLADRVGAALTGSTAMLAIAFVLVLALVVRGPQTTTSPSTERRSTDEDLDSRRADRDRDRARAGDRLPAA
jgi:hypothetical protein